MQLPVCLCMRRVLTLQALARLFSANLTLGWSNCPASKYFPGTLNSEEPLHPIGLRSHTQFPSTPPLPPTHFQPRFLSSRHLTPQAAVWGVHSHLHVPLLPHLPLQWGPSRNPDLLPITPPASPFCPLTLPSPSPVHTSVTAVGQAVLLLTSTEPQPANWPPDSAGLRPHTASLDPHTSGRATSLRLASPITLDIDQKARDGVCPQSWSLL